MFCSAPSASFSIEYSTAPYEEDEVNSPPPNLRVVPVASPSPLQPRHITGSPCIIGGRAINERRIVYDAEAQPAIVHHSLVSASPLLLLLHCLGVFAMYDFTLDRAEYAQFLIALLSAFCFVGLGHSFR